MENIEFKVAVAVKLGAFVRGCSVTANEKVLGPYEIQALKHLLDQGIICLDISKVNMEGLTENDKAGRYRLNESHRVKAEKLIIHFEVEINKIRRSN